MKGLTEFVFILDRSGSMSGFEADNKISPMTDKEYCVGAAQLFWMRSISISKKGGAKW